MFRDIVVMTYRDHTGNMNLEGLYLTSTSFELFLAPLWSIENTVMVTKYYLPSEQDALHMCYYLLCSHLVRPIYGQLYVIHVTTYLSYCTASHPLTKHTLGVKKTYFCRI